MKSVIVNESGLLEIRFPYNAALVDVVRNLPGRQYVNERGDRRWIVPPVKSNIDALQQAGFDLPSLPSVEEVPSEGFDDELAAMRPYQREGTLRLEKFGRRALLADEPGLGKTVECIALARRAGARSLPIIVVCPATAKHVWQAEFALWWPALSVHLVSGRTPYVLPKADAYILNYDITRRERKKTEEGKREVPGTGWADVILQQLKPATLFIDEAHRVKDNGALQTKAVKRIAKQAASVITLTGTPVELRPAEIFNAVSIPRPDVFPSQWRFLMRYCDPKHNGFGWKFDGATHAEELHELLVSSCMVRRLKRDVLTELPEKQRAVVPLDIDNRKEYELAEEDFVEWLRRQGKKPNLAASLARYEALKQLAAFGKFAQAVDWTHEFLESVEKLIIFCHHRAIVEKARAELADYGVVVISGGASDTQRSSAVEEFQYGNARVFIGSLAANESITLTAASNVAFFELWSSPAKHAQASDRVHRFGQTADKITEWYLVAERTVEEQLAKLLDTRAAIVGTVVDGTTVSEDSFVSTLFQEALIRDFRLR